VPSVSNKAYVAGGGQFNTTNDSSRVTTPVLAPDLTLAKVANGTFTTLSNATYTLTVTNAGTGPTTANIVVTDTLATGLTFVSGIGTGWAATNTGNVVTATYTGPALAANATASFTLTVAVGAAAAPSVNNRAWAAGGGEVNTTNNGSGLITTPVNVGATPNVTISKSVAGGSSPQPGTVLTYTITFTNTGNANAVNVVVDDEVPAQLQFQIGSPSITLPGGITATTEYFNGTVWTYTPVSAGCGAPAGFDGCVRKIRWSLSAPLAASAGGTATLSARVK
jgi:uncharacterized repeat protein (TIGR01451 family)